MSNSVSSSAAVNNAFTLKQGIVVHMPAKALHSGTIQFNSRLYTYSFLDTLSSIDDTSTVINLHDDTVATTLLQVGILCLFRANDAALCSSDALDAELLLAIPMPPP